MNSRKQTGQYYTPTEWADTMAAQSLGLCLMELRSRFRNNPQEHLQALRRLRVLDPACGDGALLCAAARLLQAEYATLGESPPHLSAQLCGIDISATALAETAASLAPYGGGSLHCGNALVSEKVDDMTACDYAARYPEVAAAGGFDVIIANPPYVFARSQKIPPRTAEWLRNHYPLARYQLNLYGLFMEQIHRLLRPGGRAAILTPNTWLNIHSFEPLRRHLLTHAADLHITNIRGQIFAGARVDVCLTTYRNAPATTLHYSEQKGHAVLSSYTVAAAELRHGNCIIPPSPPNRHERELMQAMQTRCRPLSDFAAISSGLKVYELGKGTPPQTADVIRSRAFHTAVPQNENDLPWLDGRDVGRYTLSHSRGLYLRMGPHLAATRRKVDFRAPRILVRQIPAQLPHCIHAAYTEQPAACDINCHIVHNFCDLHPLAILALLNSPLTSQWFAASFGKLQRSTFPQFKVRELAQFPIPLSAKEHEAELIRLAHPGTDAELTALHCKLLGLSPEPYTHS
ncbi:MAG: N-6 DNA methylase [Akkermansia sp.]|nr:N-6 DNA methylase [Akkermansia sp.]